MLRAGTRAVMMLAAFAIFFALVCPIAPTPMAVQKYGSTHVSTAPIALNAALVVAFSLALVQHIPGLSTHPSAGTNELSCVRLC